MAPQRINKTEKLDLRLTKAAKEHCRRRDGCTQILTDFVLDAALREAEERLADQRDFVLDAAKWDALMAALDAPPRRQRDAT